jgi:hypothetical protein
MQTLADHNRLVAEARVDSANVIAARALLYDDEKTGCKPVSTKPKPLSPPSSAAAAPSTKA